MTEFPVSIEIIEAPFGDTICVILEDMDEAMAIEAMKRVGKRCEKPEMVELFWEERLIEIDPDREAAHSALGELVIALQGKPGFSYAEVKHLRWPKEVEEIVCE